MRRLWCVLLLMCLLFQTINAVNLPNDGAESPFIIATGGINSDTQAQAEMLKKLHLFLGTDSGFELEREMTRVESAVMLVRFLGDESAALAGSWTHPFTDVPQWADKYIGYMYENGLTKGMSATKFGAEKPVTYWQYCAFLSRVLYPDLETDKQLTDGGTYSPYYGKLLPDGLKRGAAVALSVQALTLNRWKNGECVGSLMQYLLDKGTFTLAELARASYGVLESTWYHRGTDASTVVFTRACCGVLLAQCSVPGEMSVADGMQWADADYFYTTKRDANRGLFTVYRVDADEMTALEVGTLDGQTGVWLRYLGHMGDAEYLLASVEVPGKTFKQLSALLCVRGGVLTVALDAATLWGDIAYSETEQYDRVQTDFSSHTAVIYGKNNTFLLTAAGIQTLPPKDFTQTLYESANGTVTYLRENGMETLACRDAQTGTVREQNVLVLSEFGNALQMKKNPDGSPARYSFENRISGPAFYGDNGLFLFGDDPAFPATLGALFRISDGPVETVCQDGGALAFLSVLRTADGNTSEVFRVDTDGTRRCLLPQKLGLFVNQLYLENGALHCRMYSGGKYDNGFVYRLADGGITVVSYLPYADESYLTGVYDFTEKIAAEQARIDALS